MRLVTLLFLSASLLSNVTATERIQLFMSWTELGARGPTVSHDEVYVRDGGSARVLSQISRWSGERFTAYRLAIGEVRVLNARPASSRQGAINDVNACRAIIRRQVS